MSSVCLPVLSSSLDFKMSVNEDEDSHVLSLNLQHQSIFFLQSLCLIVLKFT